MTLHFT